VSGFFAKDVMVITTIKINASINRFIIHSP
jgi:hypothetical protein